jgi:hypothetical protein
MCKAPKPPEPKEPDKPEYLRNAYLDAAVGQSGVVQSLRKGRSSFRIDLDSGLGITAGAQKAAQEPVAAPAPAIQPISQRPVSRRGERRAELR